MKGIVGSQNYEATRVRMEAPEGFVAFSAREIATWMWKNRESEFGCDDNGRSVEKGEAAKFMRLCADVFFSKTHWKDPFYVKYPEDAIGRDIREWVAAAVIWYHGDRQSYVDVKGAGSHGYGC